ncbi:hypothetical protein PAMA_006501 [Pampus argenteus]
MINVFSVSECGQVSPSPSTRIVGGTEAVKGAWPWQVSLQIFSQHICGGSIISSYWIVSAAHCFEKYSSPEVWKVHSGDVSLYQMSYKNGKTVYKIISHEKYDRVTKSNDIALLKLDTPLTFTQTVKPVCLPNIAVDLSAGQKAWITGWGALRSSAAFLRLKVQVRWCSGSEVCCGAAASWNDWLTDTHSQVLQRHKRNPAV